MKGTLTKASSRRPSLQDVAKMAGVSAAAVSYVVNGRTREVGANTLEKIEAAIKVLKYQPQRRGLSLRYNREFAIGLVIMDANPSFLADPFTTQIATGLSNELVEPGYGLTVTGCRSIVDLGKLLGRSIGVDAFVIIASGPREVRERAYRLLGDVNLPFVVIQDDVPGGIEDACAILQDDFSGAHALTRHLLGCGARRFLFVAPACAWPAIERRENGIRSALPEGSSLSRIACEEQDFAATAAAIEQALDGAPLPDAIMGANDQIAITALRVLHRRGVEVPREVQVSGYNDFTFRNYVTPLLTTVISKAYEIGRSGARSILKRLDQGSFEEKKVELAVSLDLGGTTIPGRGAKPGVGAVEAPQTLPRHLAG